MDENILKDMVEVMSRISDQIVRVSGQNTCLGEQLCNIEKRLNQVNATDKGPCPYCRESFINFPENDFCGKCGRALNR